MALKTARWDASEFLDSDEAIAAYLNSAFEDGDPGLIAAAQQDHHSAALRRVVHAVAGTVIDAHLADAASDRFHVARVAVFEPGDARDDTALGILVAQAGEPIGEFDRPSDLDHSAICNL